MRTAACFGRAEAAIRGHDQDRLNSTPCRPGINAGRRPRGAAGGGAQGQFAPP